MSTDIKVICNLYNTSYYDIIMTYMLSYAHGFEQCFVRIPSIFEQIQKLIYGTDNQGLLNAADSLKILSMLWGIQCFLLVIIWKVRSINVPQISDLLSRFPNSNTILASFRAHIAWLLHKTFYMALCCNKWVFVVPQNPVKKRSASHPIPLISANTLW